MKPLSSELRVVVLSGAFPPQDLQLTAIELNEHVARVLSDSTMKLDICTVSFGPPITPSIPHITLNPNRTSPLGVVLRLAGGHRLRDLLARFSLGRLVNSLGPLAPSRTFTRSAHADSRAANALAQCDVAVALDLDATMIAWKLVRGNHKRYAYFAPTANG